MSLAIMLIEIENNTAHRIFTKMLDARRVDAKVLLRTRYREIMIAAVTIDRVME
jgi:hypothetical protein